MKTIEIEIVKFRNAGHFWAQPVLTPELASIVEDLNDHFQFGPGAQAPAAVPRKGMMCVVQKRNKYKCWFRAQIQALLQTLNGPQANVFLVDIAETTLVPYFCIKELPEKFRDVPFQMMECNLTGVKPVSLQTSYFDPCISKPGKNWDEAANEFFKTFVKDCPLQVNVASKDEESGAYNVLLFTNKGHTEICVNDELVRREFAVVAQDEPAVVPPSSELGPAQVAQKRATEEEFQRQQEEFLANLKAFVMGRTGEQSSTTDEETEAYRQGGHLFPHTRRYNTQQESDPESRGRDSRLPQTEARIPRSGALTAPSSLSSSSGKVGWSATGRMPGPPVPEGRAPPLRSLTSSDEEKQVRFLSARIPATGIAAAGAQTASAFPKPILKKSAMQPPPLNRAGDSHERDTLSRFDPQRVSSGAESSGSLGERSGTKQLPASILPSQVLTSKGLSPPKEAKQSAFVGDVFVHSEGAPAPRPFSASECCVFGDYLSRMGVLEPNPLQAHSWPALLRGRDVVGVAARAAGKTLAYLLPLVVHVLEERDVYSELPLGNGPLVLVLSPSWSEAAEVYETCLELTRRRPVRVHITHGGGAEEEQILPLINGCELLIATPPCLLRMLRKGYTTLDRLCHVVFDGADVLVEDSTLEIKEIMRRYAKLLKSQPGRSAPRQAVVMSRSWSAGVASLTRAYLGNPLVIMSDVSEAAMFAGVPQVVRMCGDEQQHTQLLGFLESSGKSKDVCIFTQTAREADQLGDILGISCHTLVAHEFRNPGELADIRREWNTPHRTESMPVLVLTDAVIDKLAIRNSSCVIHFNLPASRAKFGRRLLLMADTFATSKDHSCMSVIFLFGKSTCSRLPQAVQLSRRAGQEVPSYLEEGAAAARGAAEAEKKSELCHFLKAYGECRFYRDFMPCNMRHVVRADVDAPGGLPKAGTVKVLVLHVEDASCCWVRLLEHRTSRVGQATPHVRDYTAEFLELAMNLSKWFAQPSNCVRYQLVKVGDLCAIKEGSSFHRVKVNDVTKKDNETGRIMRVQIQFVDKGLLDEVETEKLLTLPENLQSVAPQAIEVFIGRVQPLDKDHFWTHKASGFVRRMIVGKEMEGRVSLSIGSTLWLDPLVERTLLKSINVITNLNNVRMELLKEGLAVDNKQHIGKLRQLCESVIDLTTSEHDGQTDALGNDVPSSLETAVLPEEGFTDVYMSAVESPGLFFVQLMSATQSLEDLRAQVDLDIGKVEHAEVEEIAIGSLCVAKFTRDDKWYRARILGARPGDEYDVFYVDYGDREWVSRDRIRLAWHSILHLPQQAIECSLTNVEPLESDWSEEASDAFWEITRDKLLVAKVKSKSGSLVAGCHKFVVELYDTTTEHDLVISRELVAMGHVLTSPDFLQSIFPEVAFSCGQQEYVYPFERIPEMCLRAHKSQDQTQKLEIVKEIQTLVMSNEEAKDAIRETGGIHCLCQLLSITRGPSVQQYILASLAVLAFGNDRNCEEINKKGGVKTMCYILDKTQHTTVQAHVAWALQNLARDERIQDEVRDRGGVKSLCGVLETTTDKKVQERVVWAIGSLATDNVRTCRAVLEHGGLKRLCEIVSNTTDDIVLERGTWALAVLATDATNRNHIRQFGGLAGICRRLSQDSSSEQPQFVKQGLLTLKTLTSTNSHNSHVMIELGLIDTLRSIMATPERCGIITRRVCWDLYQRLVGWAKGTLEMHARQQATPRENGTQQGLSPRAENPGDDDDDMPPLSGGEDEDDKEQHVTATSHVVPGPVGQHSDTILLKPIQRQDSDEHDDALCVSAHPSTVWSQTKDVVRVSIKLRGILKELTEISETTLRFRTKLSSTIYELDLELFERVDPEESKVDVKGAEVLVLLKKMKKTGWPRLLKEKDKLPYVSIDFDRWEVWSSSDEEEDQASQQERKQETQQRPRRCAPYTGLVRFPEKYPSDSSSGEDSTDVEDHLVDFN